MIDCPAVRKDVIRGHYDLSTLFYRLLWGPHIHHGLWTDNESPRLAQQRLTETLAREAAIARGDRVLDIGCGMGASSVYLARHLECDVTGITLSPFQRRWAGWSARWHGVASRARFLCGDAEQADFPVKSFDALWSIECTEHLFDKPAFFRHASEWLRPGGRVGICAWLAGEVEGNDERTQQVYDVCEGFFCPSLGTADDYKSWLRQAGLVVDRCYDWTDRVAQTWEICRQRTRWTGVRLLARLIDRDTVMFLDRFETILAAYRSGAMRYGCFVAHRPD